LGWGFKKSVDLSTFYFTLFDPFIFFQTNKQGEKIIMLKFL